MLTNNGWESECNQSPPVFNDPNWYEGVDIKLELQTAIVLTEFKMEFTYQAGNNAQAVQCYLSINNTGAGTGNPSRVATTNSGSSPVVWMGQQSVSYLEAGAYVGYGSSCPGGKGIIKRILLRGTGRNPFNLDESDHQTALDTTFAAVRDALQANPSANINTLVASYKDAIEDAFGVTFEGENSAPNAGVWTAISLHFARQGLQKTAEAFEAWVEAELDNECIPVDRFALFRRIMGNITFKNMAETRINFAESNQDLIKVFQRPKFIEYYVYTDNGQKVYAPTILVDSTPQNPPAQWNPATDKKELLPQYDSDVYLQGNLIASGRQAVMTPNNLIHELGHTFDAFAGYGFKKIGSIENALNAAQMPTSRDGMGPEYLQVQFYLHATISEDSTTNEAIFTPIDYPTSYNPTGYLLHDVMGDNYNTWNSSLYTNLYGNAARIDTNVQNPDTNTDYVETAADSFLNWVINGFEGTAGANWQAFYADNIGIFLRNATIYNYPGGMVQFYKDQGVIPQMAIDTGTRTTTDYSVRLYPQPINATEITSTASLPSTFPIFGWQEIDPPLNDGSVYWLLIADNNNRLVWAAEKAIGHDPNKLNTQNKIDPTLLNPSRAYTNLDLSIIMGE